MNALEIQTELITPTDINKVLQMSACTMGKYRYAIQIMYLETAFLKIRTILQANTIVARIMDAIFFSQAKIFILISINLSKISLYHNMI
jgi:hypothetical protein